MQVFCLFFEKIHVQNFSRLFPSYVRFSPGPPFCSIWITLVRLFGWWICGKLLPSRFRYLAVKQFTTKRIDKWKSKRRFTTCQHFHSTTTTQRRGHFCVWWKKTLQTRWHFPATCVPCGLLQSRNVPVNWDNEKKTCTQKGTPSLSKAIRIVTPCLPGTSDGTHTSNRPNTSFYSAAPTLLKSCLSPRSPGGLTISRYVLD